MVTSTPGVAYDTAAILPFPRVARPTPDRVLLSPPELSGRELATLAETLESGWLAPAGPTLTAFEHVIAEAAAQPEALALASGTAALHLAYRVLGVAPGDEVWTTTLTFIATIAPAVQLGATPRFLDVCPESWTLDPDRLRRELAAAARRGRLPRVVVPADLFGQPADIQAIRAVCERWGVPVLSDSACALGAEQHGRPAGHGAALVVHSFNGNKIVTASGGGALSGAPQLLARARHLAHQAREPVAHYQHETVGHNYGMSSLIAAVGLAQMPDLARRVERRRAIFAAYREGLADLPGVTFMPEPGWARSTRWLTAMQVDPRRAGMDRELVRMALAAEGIESRPVWKPMHLQPAFRDAPRSGGALAATLFERGLCLPSGQGLTAAQQQRIIGVIRGLARRS
ncbi:MAG: DegT/DnrJ/EryC1/StrS family aminotransferase [Rubritepida sp.]|jgi:dTDP-4-amino-4,6-dideoxygalactose transaminase|nr:DegT/DnrJ/EryC1/StrS family aminotransferase [Rubritepida sp.]MCU0943949.1 DegT/DnrJ/EryC1/StrS family aminotransferase [Rubritepida sp.]